MVEKEGFSKKKTFLFLFVIISFAVLSSIFFNQLTGNWMKYGAGPYYYNCSNCSDCSAAIVDASAGDIVLLNATITYTPQSCINLTNKANIIFDCQNNIINGSGYGIWLIGTNNSQIRNCKISSFVSGIYLYNSISNTLANINTSRNIGAGVSLYSSNNTVLTGITANNNNGYGIYAVYSHNTIITNTTTNSNNYQGIVLSGSNNNSLSDLNITYNLYVGINFSSSSVNSITNVYVNNDSIGIFSGASNNYTLKNSHIENNNYGLFSSPTTNNSLVYNNSFNNYYNIYAYAICPSCYFNTTKTLATNIIGKSYTGGNFWATPTGTGFSQNCTSDLDNDSICDYPYNLSGSYDFLPLIYNITNVTCTENWTACTDWSSCVGGNQTRTCTDSNSCGTNVSRPSLNQTCTYTNYTNYTSRGGSGNWCYQEFANVSTACGGLNTGGYTYTGTTGVNPQYAYDGSWSTGGGGGGTATLYINYTKPSNALSSSLWQVRDTGSMRNFTINSSCWTYNSYQILNFKAQSTAGSSAYWFCYGSWTYGWIQLSSYTGGSGTLYEEAMIWNMTTPSNATTPGNTTTPPSSGGGGGTGANSTTGIGTNVTQNVTTITPTNPAVITLNDSQIYLTKITLNVLESIQSASVTVTKVNVLENATLKMGLPSGQLYQGFKIETSGVTNSNIANVTIEFKVNKLWLASKNGTVSGIGLYRRPDTSSQWNGLVTTLTSQDSEYYYFTSVSPGFSTFAVFFKSCQGTECETAPTTSKTIIIYVIIAIVGIAILVTSYILFRKIKKKQS